MRRSLVFLKLLSVKSWQNLHPVRWSCSAGQILGRRSTWFIQLNTTRSRRLCKLCQVFQSPHDTWGGGYTMRNVARLWTYETSVLLETDISNNLPANKYFEYFGPSYKLHIDPLSSPQHKNENTDEYVQKITSKVLDILRKVETSPSVQINTGQPGTGG